MIRKSLFLRVLRHWKHNQKNWTLTRKHLSALLHLGGYSFVSPTVCQSPTPHRDTEHSPAPAASRSGLKIHYFKFISDDPLILSINPPKQGSDARSKEQSTDCSWEDPWVIPWLHCQAVSPPLPSLYPCFIFHTSKLSLPLGPPSASVPDPAVPDR